MPEGTQITWDDVSGMARQTFPAFWIRGYELEWAHVAWDALSSRGLTKYGNSLERIVVLVRFLCLAVIYYDFSYVAWGMYTDKPRSEWADDLDIHPVRIGQLLDMQFDPAADVKGDRLTYQALEQLIELQRSSMYRVLLEVFGGETGLSESLLLTAGIDMEGAAQEGERSHNDKMAEYESMRYDPDLLEVVLECGSGEYMEALRWISDGMTRPL